MKRLTFLKGLSLVPVLGLLSGIRLTEDNPVLSEKSLIEDGWEIRPGSNDRWMCFRKGDINIGYVIHSGKVNGHPYTDINLLMYPVKGDWMVMRIATRNHMVMMKTIRNMYNTLVQSYNT